LKLRAAPSKLLDFEGGINIALGLPMARTSVDHGTAFDIAGGTGSASTHSLIRAIEYAGKLIYVLPAQLRAA
jgi:4-hydroxythreonine-4-phosphate dehydrogenase